MAGRFPIYRTEKTLPGVGPNVTGRVNFDTGAGQMAAAIGRMGEVMFQVGGQMWQVQADQQYSEATAELRRKQNELQARIEANPDEDTYQEEMTRTLDEMENIPESLHLKNRLAARKFGLYLEVAKPEIENYVATKTKQRIDDKWWGTYYDRMAEAERTGNISAFESLGRSGIGTVEEMNEKVLTKDLVDLKNTIEYNNGLNWALTDPEGLLDAITTKDGKLYLPNHSFTPGQIIALRANAEGTINFRERRNNEATTALYGEADKKASNNTTPEEMKTWVKGLPITPQEQTAVMKRFLASSEIWNTTGTNPYTTRQDNAKFKQMQEDAIDGKMTEAQIREEVGKTITINDGDALRNLINGKGTQKGFEDSAAAKYLEELVNSMTTLLPKKKPVLREKGYRLLYNAIEEAEQKKTPLTEWEKKEVALRVFNGLEKEALTIKAEPSAIEIQKYELPTEEEFKATVSMLRSHGWDAAAKLYYNKWIDVLWPK